MENKETIPELSIKREIFEIGRELNRPLFSIRVASNEEDCLIDFWGKDIERVSFRGKDPWDAVKKAKEYAKKLRNSK